LVFWIVSLKETVERVRSSNEPADSITLQEWDNLSSLKSVAGDDSNTCADEYEQVAPLLSTTWHQGCVFNSLLKAESEIGCTNLPCDRVYAGCVPIAMAQVMKYYKYPSTYNWGLMPNASGSSETA